MITTSPAAPSLSVRRIPSEADLFQQRIDPSCLTLISARQAWDHLALPLRMEAGALLCATTDQCLSSVVALMSRSSDLPVRYLLTETRPLEQLIAEQYDYEGIDIDEERN